MATANVKLNTSDCGKLFHQRLRAMRMKRHLTQSELVVEINALLGQKAVSSATISDWERSVSPPNLPKFVALCKALAVSPAWLSLGIGPESIEAVDAMPNVDGADSAVAESASILPSDLLFKLAREAKRRESCKLVDDLKKSRNRLEKIIAKAEDLDEAEIREMLDRLADLEKAASSQRLRVVKPPRQRDGYVEEEIVDYDVCSDDDDDPDD